MVLSEFLTEAPLERIKSYVTWPYYFKVTAMLLSSGLNWIRQNWWEISGLFISDSTGISGTAYKVLQALFFGLFAVSLLAINFAVKIWPDRQPLLVVWAVLCIAFTGQFWGTYLFYEHNPQAYPETAEAMSRDLPSLKGQGIALTAFTIVFVLVIPAVAWKAIKKQASGNQNRGLSQEAP